MIHHRIDIPRADKKAESRLAEFFKIVTGVPIGLCDYDGITETFQSRQTTACAKPGWSTYASPDTYTKSRRSMPRLCISLRQSGKNLEFWFVLFSVIYIHTPKPIILNCLQIKMRYINYTILFTKMQAK